MRGDEARENPWLFISPIKSPAQKAVSRRLIGLVVFHTAIVIVVSEGHRRVPVRVVGPGLRAFGVTEPLEAPQLDVHRSGISLPVTFGTAWSERAAVDSAAAHAGAFPLPADGDRGTLLALPPGAYIFEVSGSDSRSSGEVPVEVYQLP